MLILSRECCLFSWEFFSSIWSVNMTWGLNSKLSGFLSYWFGNNDHFLLFNIFNKIFSKYQIVNNRLQFERISSWKITAADGMKWNKRILFKVIYVKRPRSLFFDHSSVSVLCCIQCAYSFIFSIDLEEEGIFLHSDNNVVHLVGIDPVSVEWANHFYGSYSMEWKRFLKEKKMSDEIILENNESDLDKWRIFTSFP